MLLTSKAVLERGFAHLSQPVLDAISTEVERKLHPKSLGVASLLRQGLAPVQANLELAPAQVGLKLWAVFRPNLPSARITGVSSCAWQILSALCFVGFLRQGVTI